MQLKGRSLVALYTNQQEFRRKYAKKLRSYAAPEL